jgi:ElaB/YqjD/DUF883 family membrane-anchored ribosome-binding protein
LPIGQQANASDGSAAEQAQQKVQDVGRQAQQQAQNMAGQARDRIRGQVDQRSTQAGEQIAGQAGDIRTVAQQLREQGKDKPAQLAEQAAQQGDRVASYLKESDAHRMIGDAESFARRRPWAVVAGGVALGFAASRMVKASSSERYRQSQGRPTPPMLPPPEAGTVTGQPAHGMAHQTPVAAGDGDGLGGRAGTDW